MKPGGRPLPLVAAAIIALTLSAPAAAPADTISVTTLTDDFAAGGGCSLREAVQTANGDANVLGCTQTGSMSDADTITLDALPEGGSYFFSRAVADMANDDNNDGDLDVTETLTIEGDGADADPIRPDGIVGGDRAIHVLAGDLTVRDLEIRKGNASGAGGGAILSLTGAGNTVSATRVRFDDNNSTTFGGAIEKGDGGTMFITDSTFFFNTAGGLAGGAVDTNAVTSVHRTTFTLNTAFANTAGGAAIAIYGNGAGTGALGIVNSTFNDNDADSEGAVFLDTGAGNATITHSTIANSTSVDPDFGAAATGASAAGTVSLRATILNANTAAGVPSNCSSSVGPFITLGRNISDTAAAQCNLNPAGPLFDLANTSAGLGPLQDNGGPTQTMAVAFPSPAVDHVPAADCGSTTVDQRGVGRPIGPGCDVGAFEAPLPPPPTPTLPSVTPMPITTLPAPTTPVRKKRCKKRKKAAAAAKRKCRKKRR
jgi:CSLREA domain-containing protein